MVKFTANRDGRTIIGLGITANNVERLKNGIPIHLNLEELGLQWRGEVLIMYGETEQHIAEELSQFIGPQTVVNRAGRLQ